MKPFTYAQKKWAMTACLLSALTFTVSMNSHEGGLASAEFASSSDLVEGKLTTDKVAIPVKYVKSGDNEVLAVVPKVTEGKMCDVCGTTYTLNMSFDKNKDDIDALNIALLKEINSNRKVKKASAAVEDDEDSDKPTKQDLENERRLAKKKRDKTSLINSLKYCDADNAVDQSECLVDNYVSRLESGKIDKDVALEVFKSHVESKIAAALMKSPDVMASDFEKAKWARNIELVASTLDKLQSNLHSNYNNVRARVMDFEKKIVEAQTLKFKTTLSGMLQNPNDNISNARATYQLDQLNSVHKLFNSMNNPDLSTIDNSGNYLSSLRKAVETGKISSTDALSLYQEYYLHAVSTIINGANRAYRTEFVNGRLQTYIDINQIGGSTGTDLPGTNPRVGQNGGRGYTTPDNGQNNQQYNVGTQNPQGEFQGRGGNVPQGQNGQPGGRGTVSQPQTQFGSTHPGRIVNGRQ